MRWFVLFKRIPLPAVLGAVVALSSYVVASIFKQDYDTALGRLRGYNQEILATRSTLLTAHISKAVIYNFEDQISTMRMQVVYMKTLLPSENSALLDDSMLFIVSPTNNDVRWEISQIETEMLDRLLRSVPPQARSVTVELKDYVKTGWFASVDDLKSCVSEADTTPGTVFVADVKKKLTDKELDKAIPDSMPVADFAKLMTYRFISVRGAEISQTPLLELMQRDPKAAVAARRLREVIDAKCFDGYRASHDKLITMVLEDIREQISDTVVPRYEKRKKWLESAEAALYMLGILIALARQAPSRRLDDEVSG